MTAPADTAEEKLIERAREGDQKAVRQIFDAYSKYLAAVCSRFLPDENELSDVLQESFVRIFTSLDKFRYRGVGSFTAWLRQVAVNESLRFLRSKKRALPLSYVPDPPDYTDDKPPDVDSVPASVLQGFIKSLPEGYRTVLTLYVFEEKSHKEIAGLLGISEGTSASQLHRARALLASMIKNYRKTTE